MQMTTRRDVDEKQTAHESIRTKLCLADDCGVTPFDYLPIGIFKQAFDHRGSGK